MSFELYKRIQDDWSKVLRANNKSGVSFFLLVKDVNTYFLANPQNPGLIEGPHGKVHWLAHCLKTFEGNDFKPQWWFNSLPANAMQGAQDALGEYLSRSDTKFTGFARELFTRLYDTTGECPHIALVLGKFHSQDLWPMTIKRLLASDLQNAPQAIMRAGLGPDLLIETRRFDWERIRKNAGSLGIPEEQPLKVSLLVALYDEAVKEPIYNQLVQGLLPSAGCGAEVHGMCDGQSYSLYEMCSAVHQKAKEWGATVQSDFLDILPAIKAMESAHQARQSLKDMVVLASPLKHQ